LSGCFSIARNQTFQTLVTASCLASALLCLAAAAGALQLEGISVTGVVAIAGTTDGARGHGEVAIWLTPTEAASRIPKPMVSRAHLTITQRNKRFDPHFVVVPVGSVIDFPNLDPFFHNVFSLFDGKRFDLGLYEAGSSRSVPFTRAGVCYIFCNIHPDMSAVVVVVDTPYYAISNAEGQFTLANVPPGRYALSAWSDRATPERADEFPRTITVSPANRTLPIIRLVDSSNMIVPHKNKYGQDYVPPPQGPLYK
jgi:plastocyanin